MKNTWFYLLVLLAPLSCQQHKNYQASDVLTEEQISAFKQSIIHYAGELPKKGNHSNKFENQFDEHYRKQADRFRLDKYYHSEDGYIYFEVSRVAPSFTVKRVATAGRLQYGNNGEISVYEEVYRTWKMEEEELNKKTQLLFSKLVAQEDLSPYMTANSKEEYIEFPDHQVHYSRELRQWAGSGLVLQAAP